MSCFKVNNFFGDKNKKKEEDLADLFLDTIIVAVSLEKFSDRLNKMIEKP